MRHAAGGRLSDQGSAAVEFALVLPLFMSLLFGVIEGGRLMLARIVLSQAVEVGGRLASLRSTTSASQVQSAVATSGAVVGVTSASVQVSINGGATAFASRSSGDTIRVSATHTYLPVVRFIFRTTGIAMTGVAITRME